MDVDKLQMDPDEARKLYEEYRHARAKKTPADYAIAAVYKRLAAGKLVIRALASVTAAGLNEQGLPKLAIARADLKKIKCISLRDEVRLETEGRQRARDCTFRLPMPGAKYETRTRVAAVPLIPVHLRPARSALKNFHILWEADWDQYPVDPYLLRRFGDDAWVVVAAWDLTAVERAVMSSGLNG